MSPDDETYLLQLYAKHYGLMYGQIIKIVRENDITKELLQDSFLQLMKNMDTLKTLTERQVITYISKTAKSVALRYMSRKRLREKWTYYNVDQDTADIIPDTSVSPETICEQRASYEELARAISRLSERDQDLLYYYYILEIDSKELSRIMGIPKRNLRQYIYMARKRAYRLLMEGGSQHHG